MTAHAPAQRLALKFQHGRHGRCPDVSTATRQRTESPALLLTTTVSTCYVWGQDGRLKEFGPDKNFGFPASQFSMRGIDLNHDRATDMVIAARLGGEKQRALHLFLQLQGQPKVFAKACRKEAISAASCARPGFHARACGPRGIRHRISFSPGVHQMVKSGGGFSLGARHFTACTGANVLQIVRLDARQQRDWQFGKQVVLAE